MFKMYTSIIHGAQAYSSGNCPFTVTLVCYLQYKIYIIAHKGILICIQLKFNILKNRNYLKGKAKLVKNVTEMQGSDKTIHFDANLIKNGYIAKQSRSFTVKYRQLAASAFAVNLRAPVEYLQELRRRIG